MNKACIALVLGVLLLSGCKGVLPVEELILEPKTPYSQLYQPPLQAESLLYKAAQADPDLAGKKPTQWYHGLYSEGSFNHDVEDRIINGKIMKGSNVARKFVVPRSGTVKIVGTVRLIDGKNAYVHICKNNEKVFPKIEGKYAVGKSEYGDYLEFDLEVNEGDSLFFIVDGYVEFAPLIAYEKNFRRLHYDSFSDTELHFVGDIHPFYEDGMMYLYYLSTNGYFTANMVQASDLISFSMTDTRTTNTNPPSSEGFATRVVREDNLLISFYGAWTSLRGTKSKDGLLWENAVALDENLKVQYQVLIDDRYVAMRDPYAFFDDDVERYRIVSLNYTHLDQSNPRNNRTELTVYTSQDDTLRYWNKEALAIKSFNLGEEPEVPQFMKIGNRWYLFAAVSGRARHHVGPLSYWIGDPGSSIEEVNWESKEEHLLHGDHLCAPQVGAVEDRFYLYGWITQNPFNSDWGGTINLPVEVFQREGGLLGIRLDPYAQKLLNKGVVHSNYSLEDVNAGDFVLQENRITVKKLCNGQAVLRVGANSSGSIIESSITAFSNSEVGFILESADGRFKIRYNDNHKLLSVAQEGGMNLTSMNVDLDDEAKLKLIVEGDILYVFLNDTYFLPVRLPVSLDDYVIRLYSHGEDVLFTNTFVYQLASKETLHN